MKKIKILSVLTGGLMNDGITKSQLDYLEFIDMDKFEIDFIDTNGAEVETIEKFKNRGANVISMPSRKRQLLKYMFRLNTLMKRNQYDVIHVHGSSSLMGIELKFAQKNHIKKRIAHSRNTKNDHKILNFILKPMFYSSYNIALACGEDAGKAVFKKNFTVFHNGKDLKKFEFDKNVREQIRKELEIKEETIAIGHIGVFNEQKNHKFIVEICRELKECKLDFKMFLIGEGENRKTIEKMVENNGLKENVKFLGIINDMNKLLNGMDLMLLPSLFEGVPNVAIEWQANGLKSLVSNNVTKECKVCELIDFISIKNEEEWKDKILKFEKSTIETRKQFSKMGCKALKENNFEIKRNTLLLEQIYSENIN